MLLHAFAWFGTWNITINQKETHRIMNSNDPNKYGGGHSLTSENLKLSNRGMSMRSNSGSSGCSSGSDKNGGGTTSSGNPAVVTETAHSHATSSGSGDDRSSSGSGGGSGSGGDNNNRRCGAGEASGNYYWPSLAGSSSHQAASAGGGEGRTACRRIRRCNPPGTTPRGAFGPRRDRTGGGGADGGYRHVGVYVDVDVVVARAARRRGGGGNRSPPRLLRPRRNRRRRRRRRRHRLRRLLIGGSDTPSSSRSTARRTADSNPSPTATPCRIRSRAVCSGSSDVRSGSRLGDGRIPAFTRRVRWCRSICTRMR